MPIVRLPLKTVQFIGSSQVLTDPCSVVKELIDNALDAHSTAIFVEISSNALNVIQVKDNGHGVEAGDRCKLAKRHCTSKIRNLADLEAIGGTSLGFRGEALASAAELSGSMIVSTRVEGEATAVSLTIGRKGEVIKEERLSLPVGTTVRIDNFLKSIPVRRQTALKSASKHLSKIRKLLQSYAFARPSVKFSLKLFKAKNETGNWIYTPQSGDHIPEAVRNILGKHVMEQCHWKQWQQSQADGETPTVRHDVSSAEESYTITAILPKSKYDPRVISNIGQFISVDNRPVSCTRGCFKQIVALYKTYLGCGTLIESPQKPKDAILCMNITCPRASYDVNIEPAKDDVLFTDTDIVLKLMESFFKNTYGDLITISTTSTTTSTSITKPRGIELLLAKRKHPPALVSDEASRCLESDSDSRFQTSIGSPATILNPTCATFEDLSNAHPDRNSMELGVQAVYHPKFHREIGRRHCSNMTADMEIGEENSPSTRRQIRRFTPFMEVVERVNPHLDRTQDGDGAEGLRNISKSTPWTFAKINTPIRQHKKCHGANNQLLITGYQIGELDEIMGRQGPQFENDPRAARQGLLTPQSDLKYPRVRTMYQSSSPTAFQFPFKAPRKDLKYNISSTHNLRERPDHDVGVLDTWIQRRPENHPYLSQISGVNRSDIQDQETPRHTVRDFVTAREVTEKTSPEFFPNEQLRSTRRSSPPNRPAKELAGQNSPFAMSPQDNRPEAELGGILTGHSPGGQLDCELGFAITPAYVEDENTPRSPKSRISPSIPSAHPDLAKALDYELRKQAAAKQWRASQSQNFLEIDVVQAARNKTLSQSVPSPHRNRYRRALAALRDPAQGTESSPTALDYNDPRAYLIRTQERDNSGAAPSVSLKRRKTSNLPFETTREESIARDLTLKIDTDALGIWKTARGCVTSATLCDTYLTSGTISAGFSSPSITTDLIRLWEGRIRKLVKTTYEVKGDANRMDAPDLQIDMWPLLQSHLASYA